ncbi:MAG: glutamate/cysteine ligase, glutamate--cysteine ligase [Candidatus Dadabacteria bacterium CSP1-2]|nr:MAG: glutamate/cysteine ligase, glutamate--cysteine ligase [Candidatus Dadabacteria bacterium CSP1-2]
MRFLDEINYRLNEKAEEIEDWIDEQSRKVKVPLYTSVDLRVSQHKITPVDTNIFPAGFNNLCHVFRERVGRLFREEFIRSHPETRKIVVVPELHTRNPYYWENIQVIKTILESEGFLVEIGLVSDELHQDGIGFKTISGKEVKAYKLKRKGDIAYVSEFVPDLILINNDFSSKCPEILRDIRQPVEPPVEMGWHTRRKNIHFEFYNKLVRELADIIEIDPWVISIETFSTKGVDFDKPEGREVVATSVELLLSRLRNEYEKRGVNEKPFVFVKSNSGTYGMSVLSVLAGDDIRTLNAEGRKQMKVAKGGKPVRDIVIQEGIPTSLKFGPHAVGEPVIYLIKSNVAGGFLRLNKGKSEFDNLNTKGMEFSCLSFENENSCENKECEKFLPPAYQIIARVASIAAGYEIEKILKEGGCKDSS